LIDFRGEALLGARDAGMMQVGDYDPKPVKTDLEVGMAVVVLDVLGDELRDVLRLFVVTELQLAHERTAFPAPGHAGSTSP
jgi:hypothetical protein